ncbi:MAG: M13 family metallopeptidase [Bacteroidales bacterium]
MKTLIYLPLMIGALATTGCAARAVQTNGSGIDQANLDTTVRPGDDFYDYATGGWQKANPLKPEYARFGSFDQLRENNREQLRQLVTDLGKEKHPMGSVAQKIGDLYNAGLDSSRLNNEGLQPLQPQLDAIVQLQDKSQLGALLGKMHRQGIPAFFHAYVDADPKNSTINLLQTYQGGLGMEERDYYLEGDENMQQIRAAYLQYIEKLFTLAGKSPEEAKKAANDILALETALAQDSYSQVDLRDPNRNYNKMSIAQLKSDFSGIDWDQYLQAAGLSGAKEISVGQVPFLKKMVAVINATPVDQLQEYLAFNAINVAAPYLSDAFSDADFDFYGKTLSGKQEQQPRWKRSLATTDGALGEAVGQMYVEKYFPAEAKARMLKLVSNLQGSLGERIQTLAWMSDSTKSAAIDKLNAFTVKIGYPDKWRDYSKLGINPADAYWTSVVKSNEFDWDYMIEQNEKPVDKAKWHMSPQTVNAYYNPSSNEICFPAGILQPPFFYLNADDAVNYGAIGVVIGHEMTHGFDDMGRQFDKNGNINDWWSAEDAAKFGEKTQVLVNQFDSIRVLGDTHANGSFTLGENIADQGGLVIAYQALEKALAENGTQNAMIDGFTNPQRFYLAYATLWAGNIRDEEILRLTKIDPHSLGRWRVNGTLPNIESFYEAFNIQPTDSMYRAPQERVVIW